MKTYNITVPLELKIKVNNNGEIKITGSLIGNINQNHNVNNPSNSEEGSFAKVVIGPIYDSYRLNIKATSRLTNGGIKKIKERLKTYSETELEMAIKNFSKNSWWMQHNSGRGIEWFFHSDARIDQFLNLENKLSDGPITIK